MCKKRTTIYINDDVLKVVKVFAINNNLSVSEVVENLIEPLLSGIYAGDLDKLSLDSTFPQFKEVEINDRSLILGMKKTTPKKVPQKEGYGAVRKGVFHTFRNGLETVVEALEEQLEKGSVMKNVRVDKLGKVGDKTALTLNNGQTIEADAVIMTTAHEVARKLFEPHGLLTELKDMPSTTVATVVMAFPEESIVQEREGTGFLVSRNSDYAITACTWTSRKWPTTTPDGKVLIRSYVGRSGDESIVSLSDSDIEKIVLTDLRKVMDIKDNPEFTIVSRWKEAMPQYVVGHRDRLEAARVEITKQFPNVKLAGASYEGVGLPDCINQGKAAMEEILETLF